MTETLIATFTNSAGARDAIADLVRFGLKSIEISVAESHFGFGTVFGTAQTLIPGRGPNDSSTVLQTAYPLAASGGMPGGIVATSHDDMLLSLMDIGLSEGGAQNACVALEAGAVLLAVNVDTRVADAVDGILERNGGDVGAD